jgi:AcrR family transcriptional regulator
MNTAQRRSEERERRRSEIVQAASELALDAGWDAVTMDAVAKRARLSRALVYLYFSDRAALQAALCEHAGEFLQARFREAVARHRRGYDQVEAIGRAYVAFAQEMPHFFEAVSRFEARTPDADGAESSERRALQGNDRVKSLMVAAIEHGIADGSIRADVGKPPVVALALWGLTHGIIQIAATKAVQIARQGVSTSELIEQAFRMLRRSLAAVDGN